VGLCFLCWQESLLSLLHQHLLNILLLVAVVAAALVLVVVVAQEVIELLPLFLLRLEQVTQ
jgi:hypothetical protein